MVDTGRGLGVNVWDNSLLSAR